MFEYFKLFIMVQGKRRLVNRESETNENEVVYIKKV